MSDVELVSDPFPKRELVEARYVRRRPRPPGSASWLLDPDLDLATLRYRELRRRARLISDSRRSADAPVRPRKAFTNEQRKAVCVVAAHERMSHEALAKMFETNKTTIARTLKESEKWLNFDLVKGAKAARKRLPPYTRLEVLIAPWAFECQDKGILITDDDFKAKAMAIAGETNMFDQPRPFTCSRKWLRRAKAHLGIVNGVVTLGMKTPTDKEDEPSGSRTAVSPNTSVGSLEASEACSPQSIANLSFDDHIVSDGYMSSVPRVTVEAEPHVVTDIALPVIPASAWETDKETIDSLPVLVQNVSPLPITEYAPPRLSYDISSGLAYSELYMPDWSDMRDLELSAVVGEYGEYDKRHIDLALQSQFESTFLPCMDTALFLTGAPATDSLALPDITSLAEGSVAPIPSAPIHSTVGMIVADSALNVTTTSSSSLPPGLPLPSSSTWPMPSFMQSVDLSVPSIPPADPFSVSHPQICAFPESIDALSAEMCNWPIEDLMPVGDVGTASSQGGAGFPFDVMSSGALLPPQWPCMSFDGVGGSDFLLSSTQP